MATVRALLRFRWLLPALGVPACVVAVGVGVQAAAFVRPSGETLAAAHAVRELLRYRVMRGTEEIDGRLSRSTCVQGWFRAPRRHRLVRGELVLLGNGERLYEFGHRIHRLGRRGPVNGSDHARFLLAGCPRFLGNDVTAPLLHGRPVDADPSRTDGISTLTIAVGSPGAPIELRVAPPTDRPVALAVGGRFAGSARLRPGGGPGTILLVRRAFGLDPRGSTRGV